MILRRLYELAQREGLLDDPAFETRAIPFVVQFAPDGSYLSIHDRRSLIEQKVATKATPAKPKRDKGKELSVPRPHGNTANPGFACFFADTLQRVLPVDETPKSAKSRETFWCQIDEAATATNDPALTAAASFGRALASDSQLAERIRADVERLKPSAGDRCTFAWHPDAGQTILEREPVRAWYRTYFQSLSDKRGAAGSQGLCQITGEVGPVPRSHATKITGIPDGLASGVSLVSYDKTAFESYGLDGAANAGIGYLAAEGYARPSTRWRQIDSAVSERACGLGAICFYFGRAIRRTTTSSPCSTIRNQRKSRDYWKPSAAATLKCRRPSTRASSTVFACPAMRRV